MQCVICMQTQTSSTRLPCDHSFCLPCIQKWIATNNVCPLCFQSVGTQPRNTLKDNQPLESLPCVDHLYPEMNTMHKKMEYYAELIRNKKQSSRNLKSHVSQSTVLQLEDRFNDMKDNFSVFCSFVHEGKSIVQAVAVLQHLNFSCVALESVLLGNVSQLSYSQPQFTYSDEDEFPELDYDHLSKKSKRTQRLQKSKHVQQQQQKAKKCK